MTGDGRTVGDGGSRWCRRISCRTRHKAFSESTQSESTRRIHKIVETCCNNDAINASLSVVNRSGTANAAELNEALLGVRCCRPRSR